MPSECKHVWRVVSTRTNEEDSPEFRSGFEFYQFFAPDTEIKARRKICSICGTEDITVELSHFTLKPLLVQLAKQGKEGGVALPDHQQDLYNRCRGILIATARGENPELKLDRLIGYSELYARLFPSGPAWSAATRRACVQKIEEVVIDVADANLLNNEPPLNAIVVRLDTALPGDGWIVWAKRNGYKNSPIRAQADCQNWEWIAH